MIMATEKKEGKMKFGKKAVRLFKEIRSELKKVIWPSRQQLVNYTISVLIACVLIGIVIWIADALLSLAVFRTLTG
jgi:preprotein translocase subunit SecE